MNTNIINYKKHSKKLATLVALSQQKDHGVQCHFERAATAIALNSPKSDILEELKKDVEKTAKALFDSQGIVQSIKNAIVTEYDSIHNGASEVFGSAWDESTQSVTLCGVTLTPDQTPLSKSEISERIYQSQFGIDRDAVNKTLKAARRYEQEQNRLFKAVLSPSVKLVDKLIEKITDEDKAFERFRKTMSFEEKVDYDITFRRTGINGVIQNSTYVDIEGIKQISANHGYDEAKALHSLIKETSKYVEAVEVDPDGDLSKALRAIKQLERLEINTKTKFTLKFRKLGNYKARGLFMPSSLVVAEDVRDTSALLHEIAHLIHLTRLIDNSFVNHMIAKLSSMIDFEISSIEEGTREAEYCEKETEIIARALEIASLLASERGMMINGADEFELIKSRAFYEQEEGIYFCFNDFDEKTTDQMLKLFELFYQTGPHKQVESGFDNFIKQDTLYTKEVSTDPEKEYRRSYKEAKKARKERMALVVRDNIDYIFTNRGPVSRLDLARHILNNIGFAGAHPRRMGIDDWAEAIVDKAGVFVKVVENLGETSDEKIANYISLHKDRSLKNVKSYVSGTILSGGSVRVGKKLRERGSIYHELASKILNNPAEIVDADVSEETFRAMLQHFPQVVERLDEKGFSYGFVKECVTRLLEKERFGIDAYLLPESLKNDLDIALLYVEKSFAQRKNAFAPQIQNNPVFARKAIEYGHEHMIGDDLKSDYEFMRAYKDNRRILEIASDDVKEKITAEVQKQKAGEIESSYASMLENAEYFEFEHTKTGEKLLAFKLKTKLTKEEFKTLNKELSFAGIAYYSRYAKGFIVKDENLLPTIQKETTNPTTAAGVAAATYGAEMLDAFAKGTLF